MSTRLLRNWRAQASKLIARLRNSPPPAADMVFASSIATDDFHDAGERPVVRRFWLGEPDQTGVVIRKGRGWAFSYAPGAADDEALFHLENHPIAEGQYVTIIEADGRQLPFKVVHCHE
jgi:hypothetical protein